MVFSENAVVFVVSWADQAAKNRPAGPKCNRIPKTSNLASAKNAHTRERHPSGGGKIMFTPGVSKQASSRQDANFLGSIRLFKALASRPRY